ncbi:MAG TPA: NmrA/HSCARG family protein [Galbitalea sp.]|nr:NmrA/HSCARG family protein [Galbitalea sp.]
MNTSLAPNTSASRVAVVGATGQQGGSVVDALVGEGIGVRALVRDPGSVAAQALLARGVDLVKGDLTDPASLESLLSGVDGVFAMSTPIDGTDVEVTAGKAIADAAARVGVPHVVFSTVGGAERNTGIAHFESKRRVEEYIDTLGLHSTFLRPVFFMENLLGFGVSLEDGALVVRLPMPDGVTLQMVAVRDIGKAAAAILKGGTAVEGKSIEIAGDELTGGQIASAIGTHLNVPARYEAMPLEAVASFGDTADMFRWFSETPSYQANFVGTRELVPDLLDFPAWLSFTEFTLPS